MLACIFSFISGCATSLVPGLVDDLNAESPCCSDYSEFDYAAMSTDKELKFSIGPGDNSYLFPAGKSWYKSFGLPDSANMFSLRVRTYLQGTTSSNIYVFVPVLTFLDESYAPIGKAMTPALYYDEGFVEGKRWTSNVEIPDGASYVVFHTDPNLINERIVLGPTESTGIVAIIESYQDRSAAVGPAGTLKTRFLPKVH